jgi:CheY-like chemotaxis protein
MDEDTAKNVFEPFFSTKGEYGTGLGMATVYGIVKQHGGNIWVYSEPGKGTTFKVYLPIVEDDSPADEVVEKHVNLKGDETILLAEDAPQVRHLARTYLKKLGYVLLEAENGHEVLAVAAEHDGPIHLLLTDVVMPNMNGNELYRKMVGEYPHLKVLYISGYTDSVIAHRGVLDNDVNFLQKPFDLHGLASKVREVLEGYP